jgi:hypothetical protein
MFRRVCCVKSVTVVHTHKFSFVLLHRMIERVLEGGNHFVLLHRMIERVLEGGNHTCGQYL